MGKTAKAITKKLASRSKKKRARSKKHVTRRSQRRAPLLMTYDGPATLRSPVDPFMSWDPGAPTLRSGELLRRAG